MSDDLAATLRLDRALDELVSPGSGGAPGRAAGALGSAAEAEAGDGEVAALVAVAAELRDTFSVPESSPEAARRGREAFLAGAGTLAAARRRRRLLVRAAALAAALTLVAVPSALAGQAGPGSTLWPVRELGQQVRVALASGGVDKARTLLDQAEGIVEHGEEADGRSARSSAVHEGRAKVDAAVRALTGVTGRAADEQRDRAADLREELDDLNEDIAEESHRGPGGGGEVDPDDDSGGRSAGSDDPDPDDRGEPDDRGGSGGTGGSGGSGGSGSPHGSGGSSGSSTGSGSGSD